MNIRDYYSLNILQGLTFLEKTGNVVVENRFLLPSMHYPEIRKYRFNTTINSLHLRKRWKLYINEIYHSTTFVIVSWVEIMYGAPFRPTRKTLFGKKSLHRKKYFASEKTLIIFSRVYCSLSSGRYYTARHTLDVERIITLKEQTQYSIDCCFHPYFR